MKLKFLSILIGIFVAGCQSEEVKLHQESTDGPPLSEALRLALLEADSLRQELYGPATRSGGNFEISPIVSHTMRSSSLNDTLYYIVNYDDRRGFAVITLKEGLERIQAISDEGSLDISDTVTNKGLAAFFVNLECAVANAYSLIPSDTTVHDFQPIYRNIMNDRRKPMLTERVRKWHQEAPYNTMCPNRRKVGCVALSTAQILSYHEWPQTIDGMNIDWDIVKNSDAEYCLTTAILLANLGSSKYLNLDYNQQIQQEDGTIEYITVGSNQNIIPTFIKLGYKSTIISRVFSEYQSYQDLKANGPLLMMSGNPNSYVGHAWVIDGYQYEYYEQLENNYDGSPAQWQPHSSFLFHCVWGEKALGNGYFRWHSSGNYIGGDKSESKESDDRYGPGMKAYSVIYLTNFQKND